MAPKIVRSKEDLARLLDEFGWFEDGSCVTLTPPPGVEPRPDRVQLVLRDGGTGGLQPGDVRTYRAARLTSADVAEWSFQGEHFFHSPQHCMEGVDLVELGESFGLTLDVPSIVRLLAHSFALEPLPEVTEPVEPWTSDRDLHIDPATDHVPPPRDWVEAVAGEGVTVAWRVYGDRPAELNRVHQEDYSGWFLERPELTACGNGGVMFRALEDGERLVIVLDRWEADDELWDAVLRAAGRMFPEATFRSGNSSFRAKEWTAHLSQQRG